MIYFKKLLYMSYYNDNPVKSLYNIDQIIQMKDVDMFPNELYNDVKTISLSESKLGDRRAIPFGSFINRVSEYYGDIDNIQVFTSPLHRKQLGVKIAKELQEIVHKVLTKGNYYSEIKAGQDERYLFDIGELSDNVYTISKELVTKMKSSQLSELLTDVDMQAIWNVIRKPQHKRTGDDYDIVHNILRHHYILRWTASEIYDGVKEQSNKKFYLKDIIYVESPIKVDMIVITKEGRFLEVTNFIVVAEEKPSNGLPFTPINVDQLAFGNIADSLPNDIEELYYSNEFYSPFKIVKRAFSLCKNIHKNPHILKEYKYIVRGVTMEVIDDLLLRYYTILKSSINILYSIRSEMKAMIIVLEKVSEYVPLKFKQSETKYVLTEMNIRLDTLKTNLANVLEIKNDEVQLIIDSMEDTKKQDNIEKKIEMLDDLHNTFSVIINFWAITYFNRQKVNPPPFPTVPSILKYDSSLVRKPGDNPLISSNAALQKAYDQIHGPNKKGGITNNSLCCNMENLYNRRYGGQRVLIPGDINYNKNGC